MGRAPPTSTSTSTSTSGMKKGPWTADEDQKLRDYINQHGAGNWRLLPEKAGLDRCGKSCRLRWTNYLRPDIKRGRFTFEEEEAIIQLHSVLGNKWSAIAARLPGRTDNEIKNYWNTHIRKRLLRMGLDPITHGPRMDCFLGTQDSQTDNLTNLSHVLSQQQQQLANPQLLDIVTTLLSINHQQQNQNPSMDDLNSRFVCQESEYNNVVHSSFGSLSNISCNMQQLSGNTTPFTSYASSPFDSTCYTSNGGMSADEEIDSVLNFEIPDDFDLSELLY